MKFLFIAFNIISFLGIYNQVNANEKQYNNEYYSRKQCIQQVISDMTSEQRGCLNYGYSIKDCSYTKKELENRIEVNCGQDNNEPHSHKNKKIKK